MLIALLLTVVMTEAPRPPNVLLIFVDDLGWRDLGCYGNAYHETPALDGLAREGTRFTRAYAACPVCSPSRASLMTGRYPARLGLTDFIPGHWRPWEKLIVPPNKPALDLGEITIAERLAGANYQKMQLGKWHLGPATHSPAAQGFDQSLQTVGRHFAPTFKISAERYDPLPFKAGDSLSDLLAREAVRVMRANRERPFLIYFCPHAVHIPLEARPETVRHFRDKTRPESEKSRPEYAAILFELDQALATMLKALDELKLRENTLVILASDNGAEQVNFDGKGPTNMSNAPLRGEKGALFEGGIRVPLIMRWPGVTRPGATCDEPTITPDLFSTILDAAGVPSMGDVPIDGVSLRPALEGKRYDRSLYWHYPHYHHSRPASAVLHGVHKLIEFLDDQTTLLFNLKDDPGERDDLSARDPAMLKELRRRLDDWRRSVRAPMPTLNPKADPARASQWRPR